MAKRLAGFQAPLRCVERRTSYSASAAHVAARARNRPQGVCPVPRGAAYVPGGMNPVRDFRMMRVWLSAHIAVVRTSLSCAHRAHIKGLGGRHPPETMAEHMPHLVELKPSKAYAESLAQALTTLPASHMLRCSTGRDAVRERDQAAARLRRSALVHAFLCSSPWPAAGAWCAQSATRGAQHGLTCALDMRT